MRDTAWGGVAAGTVCSGALWFWAQGLHPVAWAAWLAPIPVLWAVGRARPGAAWLAGAIAGLIGYASLARYYFAVAGEVPAVAIGLLQALAGGFTVAFATRVGRRFGPWLGAIAYPLAMAAIDVGAAAVSPHGSSGTLAETQIAFLPVLQVASLGGTAAVVFLMTLPGAAIALLLVQGARALVPVGLALCVAAAGFGWGWNRAAHPPALSGQRVALLATDRFDGISKDFAGTLAVYGPAIDRAAAAGAGTVVLPEKIAAVTPGGTAAATSAIVGRAKADRIVLVVGVLQGLPDGTLRNRAIVALPDGRSFTYDKHHLVPGWERSQTPGTSFLVLPDGKTGVAICKDYDFPGLGRDYAGLGAQMMLAPAWDFAGPWGADGYLHGRLAVLAGIESGFTVARAAREGLLVVSDSVGRIVAQTPSTDGMAVLQAGVPVGRATLYAAVGDWFGWICLGATVILVVARGRVRRRRGLAA